MSKRFDELVKTLGLEPHPMGGFFRKEATPEENAGRHGLTGSTLLLLSAEHPHTSSQAHTAERWMHHQGAPVTVVLRRHRADGPGEARVLGQEADHLFQMAIGAGSYREFHVMAGEEDFALLGCLPIEA